MCLLCRVIFVVVYCCVPAGGVLFVLPFVVLALLCVTRASLRVFVCVCVLELVPRVCCLCTWMCDSLCWCFLFCVSFAACAR